MNKHGYTKFQLLGHGAYAKVYLVKKDNIKYALKQVDETDPFIYKITMNEINILKHCDHHTVPHYTCHFTSRDYLYLIMEYSNGTDLSALLNQQYYHCFSQSQVLYYADAILLGIAYLHSEGITHCDLKLENVLVNKNNQIKIIDYNLSVFNSQAIEVITYNDCQVMRPSNKLKGFNGTIEYLAPEIVNEQDYTCMIDFWSFGIIIYELLYGETPFQMPHEDAVIKKIKLGLYQLKKRTLLDELLHDNTLDLITKLLKYKATERLGYLGDYQEIRDHPFFNKND